ncbi:rhomboid-related protein 4-like [Haemaphysalis longicornis]
MPFLQLQQQHGPHFAQPTAVPWGAILLSGVLLALQTTMVPDRWKQAVSRACVTSDLVIGQRQWHNLLLPGLHSSDPLHTAYTVVSLLGLGYHLEGKMGSGRFVGATVGLTAATNLAFSVLTYYVLPNLKEVAGVRAYEMRYKCFLGLTATLIAMKGLYCAYYPGHGYLFLVFLVPVPMFIGVACEVTVLYFALPHLWIVGNVSGAVVGMLIYWYLRGQHIP